MTMHQQAKHKDGSEQDPTRSEYGNFAAAYDFFNRELFEGKLPRCLITLQRRANTFGYLKSARFESRTGLHRTDEIALNHALFAGKDDREILSTLVHEMVHLWQQHHGKPGRGRYHNAEWADRMDALGLTPSDTGKPGGKRTGQRMSHFVVEGGPYAQAYQRLAEKGFRLNWQSREAAANKPGGDEDGEPAPKDRSKVKYTCWNCGQNCWAKSGSRLVCGKCNRNMAEQDNDPPPTWIAP